MNDSGNGFLREASLNELLHEPIIAMVMTSDGVHSDDIRALFRRMAEKDGANVRPRALERFERCLIP